ncbi:MAG: hypothetical protein JSW47_08170 [Phycisphaerales bacterium]|nr:MAG: hypothetical protein JSW47_08170 [Phycisphaerales bacterium]
MKLYILLAASNSEGMFSPFFYIGLAAAVLIAVTFLVLDRWWEPKKRTQQLRQIAPTMGFSFSARDQENLPSTLEGFNLFSRGYSKTVYNVLKGPWGDTSWMVFDYDYKARVGDKTDTYRQTVAYTNLGQVTLPRFSLGPESFFHKFADIIGLRDIDFWHHPAFSKKYRLKGSDEETIRKLFNDELLDLFERKQKRPNVEADGNKIIIYYFSRFSIAGNRIRPRDLETFMEQANEIVRRFVEAKTQFS